MSQKVVNKITITISSNIDIKYSCIKSHSYILEKFKNSARYRYKNKAFITLHPYKTYENEEELITVCNDIYSIIRSCNDATIFTYKYKNGYDKIYYRYAKNEKPKLIFIQDSDDDKMLKTHQEIQAV